MKAGVFMPGKLVLGKEACGVGEYDIQTSRAESGRDVLPSISIHVMVKGKVSSKSAQLSSTRWELPLLPFLQNR
jgi:hypothetical protein